MKIDRLLSIILLLINRPVVTAKELSSRFDVSIRTIYRDMESIAAAGIPVISGNGKGGGYCLKENYRIDRQLLSFDDMLTILTALKGINTSFLSSDIENTIEKIQSLVPDDKESLLRQHSDTIIIDLAPWCGMTNQKTTLAVINHAIAHNRLVTFTYRNLKGEVSFRKIEPMTLILKTWCWYCFGYCSTKNDFRLFRLSRISQCSVLDEVFKRRPTRLADTALLKEDSRPAIAITLRFTPDAQSLVEEYFTDAQKHVESTGFYSVTVHYPEDEWVYAHILGFGEKCEVIAPEHLRTTIAQRLQKAAGTYVS